jgi:hypothetical protein
MVMAAIAGRNHFVSSIAPFIFQEKNFDPPCEIS